MRYSPVRHSPPKEQALPCCRSTCMCKACRQRSIWARIKLLCSISNLFNFWSASKKLTKYEFHILSVFVAVWGSKHSHLSVICLLKSKIFAAEAAKKANYTPTTIHSQYLKPQQSTTKPPIAWHTTVFLYNTTLQQLNNTDSIKKQRLPEKPFR